jgi:hypothetical protein
MSECNNCVMNIYPYCVKCIKEKRLPTPKEYLNELIRELGEGLYE